jgi:hypothetical protein
MSVDQNRTESTSMTYGISSRAYLERALDCLSQGMDRSLFYAAFELRCGIETRMQQYLDAWEHVSKKKKRGWEIAKLGASVEATFQLGDRNMRWEIRHAESKQVVVVLYYTPVRKSLRDIGRKLGEYLHAAKRFHGSEDLWWDQFRKLLTTASKQLGIANTGTLLGPALTRSKSDVAMNMEVLPGTDQAYVTDTIAAVGKKVIVDVSYPNVLPEQFEPTAYVWRGKN